MTDQLLKTCPFYDSLKRICVMDLGYCPYKKKYTSCPRLKNSQTKIK